MRALLLACLLSANAGAAELNLHFTSGAFAGSGYLVGGDRLTVAGGVQAGLNIGHVLVNGIQTDFSVNAGLAATPHVTYAAIGGCFLSYGCVFWLPPISRDDGLGFTWKRSGVILGLNVPLPR